MQYSNTLFTYQNQSDLCAEINDRYMHTSATFLSRILFGVAEMSSAGKTDGIIGQYLFPRPIQVFVVSIEASNPLLIIGFGSKMTMPPKKLDISLSA